MEEFCLSNSNITWLYSIVQSMKNTHKFTMICLSSNLRKFSRRKIQFSLRYTIEMIQRVDSWPVIESNSYVRSLWLQLYFFKAWHLIDWQSSMSKKVMSSCVVIKIKNTIIVLILRNQLTKILDLAFWAQILYLQY